MSEKESFLRLRQVSARVGLGRTAIYARIKDGSFPAPVSLGGNAVGFIESEVSDWIAARVEEAKASRRSLTFTDRAKNAAAARWAKRDAVGTPAAQAEAV